MHGRLPWPAPEELDERRRAVYDAITSSRQSVGPSPFRLTDDRGRLEGPFNAMLVSPDVGAALQEVGTAVRYRTSLSKRVREIAILVFAELRGSDFEWYAHERAGAAAGLTALELDLLGRGQEPASFSDEERVCRQVVRALAVVGDLDDDEYRNAVTALGAQQLAELVVLVGYYDLLALSMRVWRTPLPAGVAPRFPGGAATPAALADDDRDARDPTAPADVPPRRPPEER